MSGRYRREDFEPRRDFVALRQFVFNAAGHVPGQPIVKASFTVRRLRQLFDRRDIGYPNEYWAKLGFVPPAGAAEPVVADDRLAETAERPARVQIPRRRPAAEAEAPRKVIQRRRMSA